LLGNCVAACFEPIAASERRQGALLEAFVMPASDTSAAEEDVGTICRECSIEIVPLDESTIGVVAINRIA